MEKEVVADVGEPLPVNRPVGYIVISPECVRYGRHYYKVDSTRLLTLEQARRQHKNIPGAIIVTIPGETP